MAEETKVIFPIKRIVVEGKKETVYTLKKGTTVKCWFCKHPFKLSEATVHIASDGCEMARCPSCGRSVDCYYYLGNERDSRLKIPLRQKYNYKASHIPK